MTTQTTQALTDLMPTDPLMQAAWLGGLHWALSDDDVLAWFRESTGNHWKPGKTPIEHMIDEATGADLGLILAFARWFNQCVWGEIDGRAINGDEPETVDSIGKVLE